LWQETNLCFFNFTEVHYTLYQEQQRLFISVGMQGGEHNFCYSCIMISKDIIFRQN